MNLCCRLHIFNLSLWHFPAPKNHAKPKRPSIWQHDTQLFWSVLAPQKTRKIHPRKLTWQWKITMFSRIYIFKWLLFGVMWVFRFVGGKAPCDFWTGSNKSIVVGHRWTTWLKHKPKHLICLDHKNSECLNKTQLTLWIPIVNKIFKEPNNLVLRD